MAIQFTEDEVAPKLDFQEEEEPQSFGGQESFTDKDRQLLERATPFARLTFPEAFSDKTASSLAPVQAPDTGLDLTQPQAPSPQVAKTQKRVELAMTDPMELWRGAPEPFSGLPTRTPSPEMGTLTELVPSGKEVQEYYNLPTWSQALTTPVSALTKLGTGFADYVLSPEGSAMIVGAATPFSPAVYVKWAYDLIKGGVMSVQDAHAALKEKLTQEAGRNMLSGSGATDIAKRILSDPEFTQRFADDLLGATVGFILGGKVGAHPVKQAALSATELVPRGTGIGNKPLPERTVPNAIQIGETEALPVGERAKTGAEVESQVRQQTTTEQPQTGTAGVSQEVVGGIAGELEALNAKENKTPEDLARLEALQKQSDAVQGADLMKKQLAELRAKQAEIDAAKAKAESDKQFTPEVAELGKTGSTLKDRYGNPTQTIYHATPEDWAEIQRLRSLPDSRTGETGAKLEAIRNKYGGNWPEPPTQPPVTEAKPVDTAATVSANAPQGAATVAGKTTPLVGGTPPAPAAAPVVEAATEAVGMDAPRNGWTKAPTTQAAATPEGGMVAKPKVLPPTAKDIPPNSAFIKVVNYDGNTVGFVVFPHDGTEAGIRKAHKQAEQYANQNYTWKDEFYNGNSQSGSTDSSGNLEYVISQNGKLSKIGTPDALYALGDIKAFQKDRAQRAVEARKSGDVEAETKAVMEQVNEYEKRASEHQGYGENNEKEYQEALKQKARGVAVKILDDRFRNWAEYLENLKRHVEIQFEAAKDYKAKAEQWRNKLPRQAVTPPAPAAETFAQKAARLAAKLDKLKSQVNPAAGDIGSFNVIPKVWDAAVEAAKKVIRAGGNVADAVEAAVKHIKDNFKDKWDEVGARDAITKALSEEPTVSVPAKTAKKMESRVELPVVKDVEKLQEQLNLFNKEIGDMLESGGQFLPKELRPDVAKGAPAEKGTVTNAKINQYFVNKLSTLRREFNAAISKLAQQADPDSLNYVRLLRERFEQSFRQVQELRRVSHESLYFWNKIKAEYQSIAEAAGAIPEIKSKLPILNQIAKDIREGRYQEAVRDTIDFLRINRFTPGSWTLDFLTNASVAATRIPTYAAMDVAHLVTGKPAYRMATALRSLALNAQNWIPFKKRFRLPEEIETGIGTAAGGEFQGLPKEVMLTFDNILKDNPTLAKRLNNVDYILGGPVRLKRAVDNFFGRLGATADLYNKAYLEGRKQNLKGDDLKQFVEDFVAKPTESAVGGSIKTGKEFKFNRDLTEFEERFSRSMGVKLFVEAYPRWTFQFMRWAGEMIGADPAMWKKFATGKATAEETVNYLVKAATGWGAIVLFNKAIYDDIDANTMEYVNEKGERIRLSGRTPAPELYFLSALLRGDWDKAKASLAYLSLPGAKLLGGQPSGVLSNIIDVFKESIKGNYTVEQTTRELNSLVNDLIPGKSMLGLIRSLYDPTIREGIGSPIPGVAELLPQRINPTTGEPLSPHQKIPGTSIQFPTVGGTPIPGAARILNDVEKTLLNHGLGTARPRRTSIIDLPAEDVPKNVRHEYEIRVGQNVKRIIGEAIQGDEFKSAEFDVRRELLQAWLTMARQIAKAEINEKYGTSGTSVKSTPLNIQRLPKRATQP